MNLLKETKEAIAASGHAEADIVFIGSEESGHECTWGEFCLLADVEYNAGYGAAEVAKDLCIAFSDGQKMWRGEYDGSEWWEHSTPFKRPEKKLPITRLTVAGTDNVGWVDLAELNETPNAGLQPQTREAGLSDWRPLLGGALEDAMNAQDFAALARQVTKDLSGKTLDHATFAECGMGYSLTLHFTDGTSSTITPEHDEGFRFTTPNLKLDDKG